MWQLIQDNFISHYHEYIGDLHHMLVALSKIQTFVFSWTPLIYIDIKSSSNSITVTANKEQSWKKFELVNLDSFLFRQSLIDSS